MLQEIAAFSLKKNIYIYYILRKEDCFQNLILCIFDRENNMPIKINAVHTKKEPYYKDCKGIHGPRSIRHFPFLKNGDKMSDIYTVYKLRVFHWMFFLFQLLIFFLSFLVYIF